MNGLKKSSVGGGRRRVFALYWLTQINKYRSSAVNAPTAATGERARATMKKLPPHEAQVVMAHAEFICQVVELSQNRERRGDFETLLRIALENGWERLVAAIRRIVAGERELRNLQLDLEDRIIAEAILRGIQDPTTLPDPSQRPDPSLAAPGLAGMIVAARRGNTEALKLISDMAEQMSRVGGPMARLASVIRPLINGERDAARLCRNLDQKSEQVVLGILQELKSLELN